MWMDDQPDPLTGTPESRSVQDHINGFHRPGTMPALCRLCRPTPHRVGVLEVLVMVMVVMGFAILIGLATASPERRAEMLFWLP